MIFFPKLNVHIPNLHKRKNGKIIKKNPIRKIEKAKGENEREVNGEF